MSILNNLHVLSLPPGSPSHVRHAVFDRIVVHRRRRRGGRVMNIGRDCSARYIRYAQSAAQSTYVAQIKRAEGAQRAQCNGSGWMAKVGWLTIDQTASRTVRIRVRALHLYTWNKENKNRFLRSSNLAWSNQTYNKFII